MPEIFEIADRYTVFWNGKFVSSGPIAETTPQKMTTDLWKWRGRRLTAGYTDS